MPTTYPFNHFTPQFLREMFTGEKNAPSLFEALHPQERRSRRRYPIRKHLHHRSIEKILTGNTTQS
jgi:hypothetical protein